MMDMLRRLLILAFGGCCGLVIIPLLPVQAQKQITTWQGAIEERVAAIGSRLSSDNNKQPSLSSRTQPSERSTQPARAENQDLQQVSARATQIGQTIHDLINQERRKHGLKPLVQDDRLGAVARAHSQDMAGRNYFAHEDQRGQGPSERAAQFGYTCRKNFGSYYKIRVAENISQNWLYSSVTYVYGLPIKNRMSTDEIAASTVDGWMNSPGHRENILDSTYDRVGTGVAISPDQKVLTTQNFC